MKKIKFFFKVLWRSVSDPGYYKEIKKAKFSFSLKYLFLLLFTLALARSIVFAVSVGSLVPEIPAFVQTTKKVATDLYPEELIVGLKDGQIFTNVDEPYYIAIPQEALDTLEIEIDESSSFKNLVAIDTKGTVEDYSMYQSVFLLTDTAMAFADDDFEGGYRVYPLSQFGQEEGVISREIYDQLIGSALPYLDYLQTIAYIAITVALILLPPIGAGVNLGLRLFFLLWASALIWLVSNVLKRNLKYKEVYRLCMHTITLALLISFASSIVVVPMNFWIFFLVFFAYSVFIVSNFKKSKSKS